MFIYSIPFIHSINPFIDEEKEIDILLQFKLKYRENIFFKKRYEEQLKPIFNFNYLNFDKDSKQIMYTIINLHGNKTDKSIYKLPRRYYNKYNNYNNNKKQKYKKRLYYKRSYF